MEVRADQEHGATGDDDDREQDESGSDTARPREYPCIRCGRCLEACPYFLNPSRLARLSKARLFEEMENYSVMDCVECGSCTYACPSRIPIVQLIRTAKSQLRQPGARQP